METNPFILSGNIPDPYFCDREQETTDIIHTLQGGENICLVAPRRMGKSKLIKHLYMQPGIAENYYCFYIDLLHTVSLRDFAFAFGRCVFDTLQTRGEKIAMNFLQMVRSLTATLSVDPLSGTPQFGLSLNDTATPEYTIEQIFKYLENADKPCIICFDEFQQISAYPEKTVEALLRGYIQHTRNAHFIYSGSDRHMLAEMFYSHNRPFYKSTHFMELGAIAEDKYIDFVLYWFKQYQKDISGELISFIYSYAEGNTYTMQKIVHDLFAAMPAATMADRALLLQVINGIIETEMSRYERQLSRIPQRQQELLLAIAKEGHAEKIRLIGQIAG